jgi:hypothetical protein
MWMQCRVVQGRSESGRIQAHKEELEGFAKVEAWRIHRLYHDELLESQRADSEN